MQTPTTPTVSQTLGRIKLQPIVGVETASRLRVYAALKQTSQGEVIDQLVMTHIPAITVPPVKAAGKRSKSWA